jgi:hypothetical protein
MTHLLTLVQQSSFLASVPIRLRPHPDGHDGTIVLLGVTASPPIGELDAGSIDFEMKVFDRAMIVSDAGGGPTS